MRIIVEQTKDDDVYWAADTEEQTNKSALKIIKSRLQNDWYNFDCDIEKRARDIVNEYNIYSKRAIHFLYEMTKHEYHGAWFADVIIP